MPDGLGATLQDVPSGFFAVSLDQLNHGKVWSCLKVRARVPSFAMSYSLTLEHHDPLTLFCQTMGGQTHDSSPDDCHVEFKVGVERWLTKIQASSHGEVCRVGIMKEPR